MPTRPCFVQLREFSSGSAASGAAAELAAPSMPPYAPPGPQTDTAEEFRDSVNEVLSAALKGKETCSAPPP